MSKIIDQLQAKIERGEPFFSFEYFPPKTDEGIRNLRERQHRMVKLGPTFCDITWGAGGSSADVTLEVAGAMQNEVRAGPNVRAGQDPASADWAGRGEAAVGLPHASGCLACCALTATADCFL